MKRKLIHYASTLIHESGIQILQPRGSKKYNKSWRFFLILLVYSAGGSLSVLIQSLVKDQGIEMLINPMPYAALGCVVCSHSLLVFVYRKTLSEMLHQMDDQVYVYPDEDCLEVPYKWYLKEENMVVGMKFVLYWQVMNLWALSMPGLVELYRFRKIETFIYPGWTPWKVQSLGSQVVTFVWQFLPTLCGIWLNQIVIMLVFLVFGEFLRQYERLKKVVVMLKYRTERLKEENKRKYEDEMEKNIIHCVKHLQKLLVNFHLFKAWFSVMFSLELAIATLTLAFGIYAVINARKFSTLLHYCIVIAYMMVNLLVKCLIGEIFVDLNNGVSYTLFSKVKWVELSRHNRQLLVMFHHMTCQPLRLLGFQIFEEGSTMNMVFKAFV